MATKNAETVEQSPHMVMIAIILFAVEAARKHVELARFCKDEPDPEVGAGLWQDFQSKWPKETFKGDRDMAVTVFTTTYEETVRTIATVLAAENRTVKGAT